MWVRVEVNKSPKLPLKPALFHPLLAFRKGRVSLEMGDPLCKMKPPAKKTENGGG